MQDKIPTPYKVWWQRYPQLGGLGYVPCDGVFSSKQAAQAYVREWKAESKAMRIKAPRLEVRAAH